MRKDLRLSLTFVFSLGLVLVLAAGAHSVSQVTNLSLEKRGDFTHFTIFAKDNIEFTHFILKASNGKPHRIVVDLKDAIHRLPKYNFIDLPPGTVKAIRTSQYQVKPEKITRIVLDLKESVIYKVMEQKKKNEITLAISTKKDPPSVVWTAVAKTVKTKTKTPKKIEAKTEKQEKLVKKEPVTPLGPKPLVTEAKSEIKKDKPKPQEKPETIAAPAEVKKEKDKKVVKKGIEIETVTPEAEDVTELAKKKTEIPEAIQPEMIPAASKDTSVVQVAAFQEIDEQKKGIAERETLIYVSEGRRDPFVPLSEKIDFEFGELPLPAVENLKLVGTLEDYDGYKALLEDDGGYGYLLKAGDKVKNGYVVNVFKDRIFFQIEEYGWSRTISLDLPPEY